MEHRNGYQKVSLNNIQAHKAMPPGMTTIRIVIWMVLKLTNFMYLPFYLTRRFRKSRRCPSINNQLLLIPATELAKRIRKGEISSESVLKAYIKRVKEVNPIINAVIDERFEAALEEARQIDKMIASKTLSEEEMEKNKPLLGVPLTVKGSIEVAKMRSTSGSVHRKNVIAEKDAVPVQHAREAGAIPILLSNIPELCMNWESTNKLVGTTKNPHNTTRTSGGSSGGEASLLATAASIIGIGSDVAGSLRLPAHFCGIYGHKPTPGAVSFEGHYPNCKQKDHWREVFTLGPMSRYTGDLKLLLRVIAEPDVKHMLKLEEPVDVRKLKIFYMENMDSNLIGKLTDEYVTTLHDVVDYFNSICETDCSKVTIPQMKYVPEISSLYLLNIDEVDNFFPGRGEGACKEMLKLMLRKSDTTMNCVIYGLLRKLTDYIPTATMEGCKQKMDDLRAEFLKLLGNGGVLLFPTFTASAHYHGEIYTKIFDSAYMSVFNSIGFPVTNCPVKIGNDNLPIGIQVVAAPYGDRLTLAMAEEIEKTFGGWQPPTNNGITTK